MHDIISIFVYINYHLVLQLNIYSIKGTISTNVFYGVEILLSTWCIWRLLGPKKDRNLANLRANLVEFLAFKKLNYWLGHSVPIKSSTVIIKDSCS